MKVLRSVEWEPISWIKDFPGVGGPVYVFKNKRFGDIAALKVVKYVDVPADNVFIYDAETRIISSKRDNSKTHESSLPMHICV